MKHRILFFILLIMEFTLAPAYSGNVKMYEQINAPRVNTSTTTLPMGYTSPTNSINSTQRIIGYSPSVRARNAYNSPQNYYNAQIGYPQPVYIQQTYTPVTTTRRYYSAGNSYNSAYTEQTTRYYGNPTIRTYPAGSGMNNPNRYLNW